jgi:hypothetical protein
MAKNTNALDTHIHQVIARAVHDAVEAFRHSMIAEVTRAIGGAAAPAAPATRKAAAPKAAPGGKRVWPTCSKPGCSNKFFGPSGDARLCYQHYVEAGGKHPAQAKAPAKPAKAKPEPRKAAAKAAKGGRKARAAGGNDGLATQVLEAIAKSPGLRAEQITTQLGAKAEPVKAALASLREAGKVKVSGKARGTSYTAA